MMDSSVLPTAFTAIFATQCIKTATIPCGIYKGYWHGMQYSKLESIGMTEDEGKYAFLWLVITANILWLEENN